MGFASEPIRTNAPNDLPMGGNCAGMFGVDGDSTRKERFKDKHEHEPTDVDSAVNDEGVEGSEFCREFIVKHEADMVVLECSDKVTTPTIMGELANKLVFIQGSIEEGEYKEEVFAAPVDKLGANTPSYVQS